MRSSNVTSVETALYISQLAFSAGMEGQEVPEWFDWKNSAMIGTLLLKLGDSPAEAHSAAWALAWLNNSRNGALAWRPSEEELASIRGFQNSKGYNSEAALLILDC